MENKEIEKYIGYECDIKYIGYLTDKIYDIRGLVKHVYENNNVMYSINNKNWLLDGNKIISITVTKKVDLEVFKKVLKNLKNYIMMLKDDLEGFEDENWDLTNDNKDLEDRIEELQDELEDCKNKEDD